MVSNLLAADALVGNAMAVCPLSVEITEATGSTAQVAVTNTAKEAITVFSEHATKDLLSIPFTGSYVKYRKSNIPSETFYTIQPGEAYTASVNAARTHKLAGVEKADVSGPQDFHYVTGTEAPTSLKTTEFGQATSNTVNITPDQTTAAAEHLTARSEPAFNSRIQKRDVSYSSCTSSQKSILQTAVTDAISLATKAYTAAGTGADYFTTRFRSTSEGSKVQSIYKDVEGVRTTSPTISCTDNDNTIIPCPNNGFYGFPELAADCADDDYDKDASILHEMTHLYGTEDYAYGQTAAKKLSAAQAAANADTYEISAGSVRLGGCSS
ncbi:Metalloprotease [Xylariaceae sp. FL0255]|nr:Metalloprotease [Xylariaceae sp. FL0255]